jgi:hypothetical protein
VIRLNTWASIALRLTVLLHACLLLALSTWQRAALTTPRALKAQVWVMCFMGLLLFVDLTTPQSPTRKSGKVLDTILLFLWLILLVAGVTIAVGVGAL